MNVEEITQPTQQITQKCPCCGEDITMVPYDVGSGPEMSCSNCEWCWGANGQGLKPLDKSQMLGIVMMPCKQCGKDIGCKWPENKAPENCTEHQ